MGGTMTLGYITLKSIRAVSSFDGM